MLRPRDGVAPTTLDGRAPAAHGRAVTLRAAVLLSGSGRTLENFLELADQGQLPLDVRLVISSSRKAFGLERARRRDVPTATFVRKQYDSHEAYTEAIFAACREAQVELVLLAGYMKIVTPVLISAYPDRMMNIHPSLLPSFPGLDVQQKALDWGVKVAGCTVHFVTDKVDEGPIIIQATVPVVDGDTAETLSARILAEEHRIYPKAVQLFAEGRLTVEGRRVQIRRGPEDSKDALFSPS